ncbi:MAG: plastocyanin/azurin family copper-binding protein [Kovacikia sp.]
MESGYCRTGIRGSTLAPAICKVEGLGKTMDDGIYSSNCRLRNLHCVGRYGGVILAALVLLVNLLLAPIAIAAPASTTIDLSKQSAIPVRVSLGNAANELKFVPNKLEFLTGKRYKLMLNNPSAQKHYFTAKDFADSIWSQKVEAGKVEVKGAIRELELKPTAEAEWVFIPIKPGNYQLRCTIPGHAEAGMTGLITVSAQK